jgi:hypothetical protein
MENNYNFQKGNKILNSFSIFNDKEIKMNKAMTYFKIALREFVEKTDFLSYAELSEKIGDKYIKINNNYDALQYYKNAQKHYLTQDSTKFINLTIDKIIPLCIEKNDIAAVGKYYYQIAKLCKDEGDQYTKQYFDNALKYLESEKNSDLYNCYIDYAIFLMESNDIDSAIYYLEQIMIYIDDKPILIFGVGKYIFLILLCYLSKGDIVLTKRKLDEYCDKYSIFIDSIQHKLIIKLIQSYDENDIDKYSTDLFEYNQIKKLDKIEVGLCITIKNNMLADNEVDLS